MAVNNGNLSFIDSIITHTAIKTNYIMLNRRDQIGNYCCPTIRLCNWLLLAHRFFILEETEAGF